MSQIVTLQKLLLPAATQADVDQNDADAAIAALQADVDQNESDSDVAEAANADCCYSSRC